MNILSTIINTPVYVGQGVYNTAADVATGIYDTTVAISKRYEKVGLARVLYNLTNPGNGVKGAEKLTKLAGSVLRIAGCIPEIGTSIVKALKEMEMFKDLLYARIALTAFTDLVTGRTFSKEVTTVDRQGHRRTEWVRKSTQAIVSSVLLTGAAFCELYKFLGKYVGIQVAFFSQCASSLGNVSVYGYKIFNGDSWWNPLGYLTNRPKDFFVLAACAWNLGSAVKVYFKEEAARTSEEKRMFQPDGVLDRIGEIGKSTLIVTAPVWCESAGFMAVDFVTQFSSVVKEGLYTKA